MKFTDLTSAQRSMLTMLCTGQSFNTAELGRGCNPQFKADQAASSLLFLRDAGLVYSNQKPAGQTYAEWKASAYGRAVFAGRPGEVPATKPETRTTLEMVEAILLERTDPVSSDAIAQRLGKPWTYVIRALADLKAAGRADYLVGTGWAHVKHTLANAAPETVAPKPYRVLRVSDSGITLFDSKFETLDMADRFARTNIHNASPDTINYVVTLHKSMRYVAPVAAGVQVEELQ